MQLSAHCHRRWHLLLACCLQLLICLALPASGQGQVKCAKQINQCQCQTESGKYIDLAPLARRDDYRFKKVPGISGNWLYSFNPCFGFKCEGADNVASCQSDTTTLEFALGTQDTAQFGFILGTGLHLRYSSSHSATTRVSVVSLICSQSGADEFKPLDDGTGQGTTFTYTSSLTSKYVCEVDTLTDLSVGGGMSAGDILLIIFFVGIVAYLAGGFAVNVLVIKKAPGLDAVPNAAFWLALPGYIKDGATFCLDRVRRLFTMRGGKGYDSI